MDCATRLWLNQSTMTSDLIYFSHDSYYYIATSINWKCTPIKTVFIFDVIVPVCLNVNYYEHDVYHHRLTLVLGTRRGQERRQRKASRKLLL